VKSAPKGIKAPYSEQALAQLTRDPANAVTGGEASGAGSQAGVSPSRIDCVACSKPHAATGSGDQRNAGRLQATHAAGYIGQRSRRAE
jgi:hypothetical protein